MRLREKVYHEIPQPFAFTRWDTAAAVGFLAVVGAVALLNVLMPFRWAVVIVLIVAPLWLYGSTRKPPFGLTHYVTFGGLFFLAFTAQTLLAAALAGFGDGLVLLLAVGLGWLGGVLVSKQRIIRTFVAFWLLLMVPALLSSWAVDLPRTIRYEVRFSPDGTSGLVTDRFTGKVSICGVLDGPSGDLVCDELGNSSR